MAIDQAAHDDSAGQEASLGHFIAMLKAVIESEVTAGCDVGAVIGYSFGATAAIMLFSSHPELLQCAAKKPALMGLNPPFQPTTLMQGFCIQNGLPMLLVSGVRKAFVPSPEDVLKKRMTEAAWLRGLPILIVQDGKDVVARPRETGELARMFEKGGAEVRFERTKGLGRFKVVGNEDVLGMVGKFVGAGQ
ncbi:hypothetical protein GQ43DRAFT_485935 [Delitschia confertaspora ATCC 74209]|uniref:Uncharacterized protein n=1 Tax=Delitschia confertaspora ATCC 74209 TaxID=1513339 RepID=A0A9P4JMS5_9PLEO|nr:hypothetical protein GQ43DRAFT_485935 [Delitschia confertaspora ATCC 74209]